MAGPERETLELRAFVKKGTVAVETTIFIPPFFVCYYRLLAGWVYSRPDERLGYFVADQMDIL